MSREAPQLRKHLDQIKSRPGGSERTSDGDQDFASMGRHDGFELFNDLLRVVQATVLGQDSEKVLGLLLRLVLAVLEDGLET